MKHLILKAAKDPLWTFQKASLWGRSIAGLRTTDQMFAFYPKTGSTWVRIFLFTLLTARENKANASLSFDAVDAAMPEFANLSFFKPWPFKTANRIIKTHRPYQRFFGGRTTVLFAREPRDTMVSFLHYANAKKEFGFSGDLNDLVRHPEMGLDAFFRFYMSWLPHAGQIVRYEDLRRSPQDTFATLLTHIGIEATAEEISAALDASSLEKTRVAQQGSSDAFQSKFKEGFVFARSGSVGEGKEQFDDSLEAYFQERKAHWGFTLYDEDRA